MAVASQHSSGAEVNTQSMKFISHLLSPANEPNSHTKNLNSGLEIKSFSSLNNKQKLLTNDTFSIRTSECVKKRLLTREKSVHKIVSSLVRP